ncbi:uncharacterized protein CG45076-like isoform X4 [Onthophagus taurus]|uniref:uncharacterized protein CG45076-like isoform X4 n=1 Tax=Onthophagus taurus TaxID=166361 RepID=UPI000C20BF57|nr:uncharacterized protein CG45076-like isoform X4 [Onthophagus taurus]
MVYESDFYTTRRPYRATPSISTYTVSSVPSRQVRILPGLGKVHVVHTYDRIVPYVGHKRLTVVTSNPMVYKVRPSVLYKEFDRIENKYRPYTYTSALSEYLNSDSAVRYPYSYIRYPYTYSYTPSYYYTIYRPYYPTYYVNNVAFVRHPELDVTYIYKTGPPLREPRHARIFDDEKRLIRAETASLLRRIHAPVPRVSKPLALPYVTRYDEFPVKTYSDSYIYKMMMSSPKDPRVVAYTTYYSEPVRKYFGQGYLSCVSFAGDKVHPRRRNVYVYEDPVRNDIQLLSYYISKFRQEKGGATIKELPSAKLPPNRPSRHFTSAQSATAEKPKRETIETPVRVPRPVRSYEEPPKVDDSAKKAAQKKKEEEEKAKAEEAARKEKEAQAKKEEAARLAEIARQEELAAKAAAEKAAELERQAEKARQEELAKQAEIEKARKAAEEEARLEEERRQAELAKAEEERQQLLRLEEIARQAEEEREAELARQAEELAELARQEAELAEQAKKAEEEAELKRKEEEEAELARQEAELAELERQEKELAELAKQEAELAELAKQEAELAKIEAEQAEIAANTEEAPVDESPVEAAPAEEEAPVEETPVEVPAEEVEAVKEEEAPVEEEPVVEEPVVEEPVEEAEE